LVLGDNIFYGSGFTGLLRKAVKDAEENKKATVFGYWVSDPERYGIADSIKVQELEKEKRNEIIVSCLEIGTGLRQISRLTGVTYGVINKLNKSR